MTEVYWINWKADGTPRGDSKTHYVADDSSDTTLCGQVLTGKDSAGGRGDGWCKRCEQTRKRLLAEAERT